MPGFLYQWSPRAGTSLQDRLSHLGVTNTHNIAFQKRGTRERFNSNFPLDFFPFQFLLLQTALLPLVPSTVYKLISPFHFKLCLSTMEAMLNSSCKMNCSQQKPLHRCEQVLALDEETQVWCSSATPFPTSCWAPHSSAGTGVRITPNFMLSKVWVT